MELAERTYRETANLPSDERFGLCSQMRRAAVSVASNLAEGAARGSRKEFRQFISIARGSLSELDTQFDLCAKLGLMNSAVREEIDVLLLQVDRMLYGLYIAKRTERSEA